MLEKFKSLEKLSGRFREKTPAPLPKVGEVFCKKTRFYQDWVVVSLYKSHVDDVVYALLSNDLMGEKNVCATELVRPGSDWSRKSETPVPFGNIVPNIQTELSSR